MRIARLASLRLLPLMVVLALTVGCSSAGSPDAQQLADRRPTPALRQWISHIETQIAAHGYVRLAGGVGWNTSSAPVAPPVVPIIGSTMRSTTDGVVAIVVFDEGRPQAALVQRFRRWYNALGLRSTGDAGGIFNEHVQRGSGERDVAFWGGRTPGHYAVVLHSYAIGHQDSLRLAALTQETA